MKTALNDRPFVLLPCTWPLTSVIICNYIYFLVEGCKCYLTIVVVFITKKKLFVPIDLWPCDLSFWWSTRHEPLARVTFLPNLKKPSCNYVQEISEIKRNHARNYSSWLNLWSLGDWYSTFEFWRLPYYIMLLDVLIHLTCEDCKAI